MISSISNSEPTLPRTGTALCLTALLALAIGMTRGDPTYASAPSWYWRMKVEWHHAAEIVLIGDSRVYRGLDPATFTARTGRSAVNFGFSSAGYSPAYLDAVERVIDPGAPAPAIVIGLTPWSLTPLATRQNGFTQAVAEARTSRLPAAGQRHLDRFDHLFRPLELELLWQGAAARQLAGQRAADSNYIQDFRPNGWVASNYRQPKPSRGLLVARGDHAGGNRVAPAQLIELCARVRKWKARGWAVLAFRPPTPPEVAALTDELSDFDEALCAQQLSAAGAIWFPVDSAAYESYDGSHLTAASAKALSRQIADHLNASMPSGPRK